MLKFFKKYELQWKIFAVLVWLFGATARFFFRDDPEKRNWNLMVGIVSLVLAIVYIFDVIELIKKRRDHKTVE